VTADFRPLSPDPRASATTRFAVLTPSGRGAIATIAVRGPEAAAIVGNHFQWASDKRLTSLAAGRVAFGRFFVSPHSAEEIVVGRIGPDEVEVHCHGGMAVVQAICNTLQGDGCVVSNADQWIEDHESDPLAAQAMLTMSQATTERTAAILLDQYRGALRGAIRAVNQLLAQRDAAGATATLQDLVSRGDLGLHLTRPWQVVMAGAPNAGKSSLINAILGYQRAVVWHQPGTTRDVLTATTAIDGWPIELADTAGLRATDDTLEAEGVVRAQRQIAASDLVVFVAETTSPWDASLRDSIGANARRLIVVHNKCDLAPPPADARPSGIEISAKTGLGLDTLSSAIVHSLVENVPPCGAAVPFRDEHIASLKAAAEQLARGDLPAAREHLADIHRRCDGSAKVQ
jgi:tRNA modification GTPase